MTPNAQQRYRAFPAVRPGRPCPKIVPAFILGKPEKDLAASIQRRFQQAVREGPASFVPTNER
jgi:hypothetical protein